MSRSIRTRIARNAVVSLAFLGAAGCQRAETPVAKSVTSSLQDLSETPRLEEPTAPAAIAAKETPSEPPAPEAPMLPPVIEPTPPQPEPIVASLEAAALSRLFQASDSAEAEKLLGKRVELTGYVLQVRNLGPQRLVVLGDENFAAELPAERVLCHFEQDMSQASAVAGPRLKVKGTCQLGYGNLIVLRDCTVEEELPALEGFEARKLAFQAKQSEADLQKPGIIIDGPADRLSAKISRSHLVRGKITPEVMKRLSEIPGLRILELSGLPISDEGLREITFLGQLQAISLDSTRISATGLALLSNAKDLRRLKLDGTIESEGYAHLAGLEKLESLEVIDHQGYSQFSEASAQHLAAIKGLKQLQLDGAKLSPAVMAWIGQQKSLESLSLEYTTLSSDSIKPIESLSELKTLSLRNSSVDDAAVASLAACTHLVELDLSQTNVTDAGLASLQSLRELRRIDLSGCRIVGGGLTHLRDMGLESLSIWGAPADNEALLAIEAMTSLKKLRLGHTKITHAALGRLATLKNLEQLELTGMRLDRDALPILEGLTALKELRLSENPFEDCESCLAELSTARPGMNLFLGRYDYLAQTAASKP